jgi:hypothetical protein
LFGYTRYAQTNMPGFNNVHPADDPRARLWGRHAFYVAFRKYNNIPSMAQLKLPKAGNKEIGMRRRTRSKGQVLNSQ